MHVGLRVGAANVQRAVTAGCGYQAEVVEELLHLVEVGGAEADEGDVADSDHREASRFG